MQSCSIWSIKFKFPKASTQGHFQGIFTLALAKMPSKWSPNLVTWSSSRVLRHSFLTRAVLRIHSLGLIHKPIHFFDLGLHSVAVTPQDSSCWHMIWEYKMFFRSYGTWMWWAIQDDELKDYHTWRSKVTCAICHRSQISWGSHEVMTSCSTENPFLLNPYEWTGEIK